MTIECTKCSMNENCICIPDSDECFIRKDAYNKAVEEFREYLKTVVPCELPQDLWNFGIDNTCNRMLKR